MEQKKTNKPKQYCKKCIEFVDITFKGKTLSELKVLLDFLDIPNYIAYDVNGIMYEIRVLLTDIESDDVKDVLLNKTVVDPSGMKYGYIIYYEN